MKDQIEIEGEMYTKQSASVARSIDGLKYCIVRCRLAGVHAGYVKKGSDLVGMVTILNSRRLYYWQTVAPSLSGLGQCGIPEKNSCKFAVTVPELFIPINDIGEIQPCTNKVREQIQGVEEWTE